MSLFVEHFYRVKIHRYNVIELIKINNKFVKLTNVSIQRMLSVRALTKIYHSSMYNKNSFNPLCHARSIHQYY